MAQCTSCWQRSFHRCRRARSIAAQSAAMHRFKGHLASFIFLLVPPSESRSPPALITVRIERASHRSSSSELLIFSSISCARAHSARFPAGRMTRRYRRNCRLATEFCVSHRRKLTLTRITVTISQNSDCIIEPTITD